MKTICSVLFAALLSSAVFGQTKHFSYTIEFIGDGPQVEMIKSMVKDAKMDMYLGEKFTRIDVNMGTLATNKTIVDVEKKKSLVLSTSMMGKTATEISFADKDNDKEEHKPEVKLVDETKKIAGYNCKKAIIIAEDGAEMEIWYTEEIDNDKLKGTNLDKLNVPGFPMEYSLNKGPMAMKFTVITVDLKFKPGKKFFDMTIPEGYKVVTMEDLKAMGQGK